MSGLKLEEDWTGLGLTVLSTDADNTLVLFSSTADLHDFRERLEAYDGPVPDGKKARRYANFVERIESVGSIEPRDRIGVRARESGLLEASDFLDGIEYVVDIELWEFGPRTARRDLAEQVIKWVEDHDGELYDHYSGPSITLIRVKTVGQTIRPILGVPQVAFVDFPPEPDIDTDPPQDIALGDIPSPPKFDDQLPLVAVLDTGVNDHPVLADGLVAQIGFPPELGTADVNGHGTSVAGIVVYGDFRNLLENAQPLPAARIISAKVVTDQAQFHDRSTLPSQMRTSIEHINAIFGCRLFVLSLGDTKATLERGRVGPWAATLDELARELDVLIFVSAGNRQPRHDLQLEQAVSQYPHYLLEANNRICEPAGAANVLTVGSISHSNGLGPQHEFDVHSQPITRPGEPSPFSRTGPGAGGIKKPDFVDFGGTLVFDGVTRQLQRAPTLPNAGILTANADYQRQLLVSMTGTSSSAPHLAHRAATILRHHPGASANLVRALMASSARSPDTAIERLSGFDEFERDRIMGNGLVNEATAAYSDDHRVVLYAEDSLGMDQFAVYQIPIPPELQGNGRRWIRVSLAYDPPVRRMRSEYIGTRMNYRLIRGCSKDLVFDHFRSRSGEGTGAPEMPRRNNCELKPGPHRRDGNTLQTSSIRFTKETKTYGAEYFLVVRCIGGWAAEKEVGQRYSIVVELEHETKAQLYAKLRQRVRARM